MRLRLCLWIALAIILGPLAGLAFAQAPGSAGNARAGLAPGLILVAKVQGAVQVLSVSGGAPRVLKVGDKLSSGSIVVTGRESSVILVFSNGTTLALGSDSRLVLREFLQAPFGATVRASEMVEEPSVSATDIELSQGEIVGNVKKLRYDRGSSFRIRTPVGIAGIRGTVFRVVFRPTGTGTAYFSLSTASGAVAFSPVSPGNVTAAPPTGAVPGSGTGTVVALLVPQGQEIAIAVSVTQSATGADVVSAPTSAATVAISPASLSQISRGAAEMAVAVAGAVFPSPAPPPTTQRATAPRATGQLPVAPPPGPVTTGEAMRYFETYGGHAVWADNRTEFALDYKKANGFGRQCFEVRRSGGEFALREIPALTWPLIDHGTQCESPLVFTEPAEVRAEYYRTHPEAIPGRLEVPPGGPLPRVPKAPERTGSKGSMSSLPQSRPAPNGGATININGTTATGQSFSGTVLVPPPATTAPPPVITPTPTTPPPPPPPRRTNPGG